MRVPSNRRWPWAVRVEAADRRRLGRELGMPRDEGGVRSGITVAAQRKNNPLRLVAEIVTPPMTRVASSGREIEKTAPPSTIRVTEINFGAPGMHKVSSKRSSTGEPVYATMLEKDGDSGPPPKVFVNSVLELYLMINDK